MKRKAKSLMLILCTAVLMLSVGIASALAAGTNKAADKGIINVYLIAGQSNAVGYGEGAPTSGDKGFTEGFDNTIYYGIQENNIVSDFVPVKVGLGKNTSCVGAEIGIASTLADSNEMNAVIKCAWGATYLYPALSADISKSSGTWTSPSYIKMANDNTAGSTGASIADVDLTQKIASGRFAGEVVAGNMYNQFIKEVTEGLKLLKEDGYTPVIKGIWWMQGEAEVYDKAMSNEYATLLNYLIKDMRSSISNITGEDYSDLPFVMGKVNRNGGIDYTTGKIYSQPGYIETVRGAMQAAADNGKNIFTVECRNLAQLDGWHFSSDSQKWLGEQYVNAVRTAEGNVVTDYGTITPTYADPAKYPFALFAEDDFVAAYASLADACKKADTYDVETQILLRSNAVVSSAIGEFDSVNLDLAGNTLTANGTVFTKGSINIKNGKIVLGSADFIKMSSSANATANVVIENCSFDFTNATNGVCVVNTADANNVYDVNVTINGGEIVTNDFSKNSFYKLGDGDSIRFNKYNGEYIKMTLPSSAQAPTGNYPTDNGNAKFVTYKVGDNTVTYTLSVLEIAEYGTIDSAYESVEKYPFAVFHNGKFVSAQSNWDAAGQAARNLTAGSAKKNEVAYVVLRRDYDVTTRFYNTSQIGGTIVLDLNGYTMTAVDTIFDGTAKTVGTSSEICDTYVKVINGTMLAKNRPIITFNRNSDNYISEKTFYFTFEEVVIGLAENYAEGVNVVCATSANTASAKAYADITLNDCVFDLTAFGKASDITLFAPKDDNNEIDVEITVNGGKMLANEIDRVTWQKVDSGSDKVVFAKNSSGKYLELSHKMLNADYPNHKVVVYNADNKELTFTKVSMNDGNAIYELKESEETKYGLLPNRYTTQDSYPFVVFDKKKVFLGAYSAWLGNNGAGGVLGDIRGYLNNAWDGTSYGNDPKEAFILMRRDYTMDASKDISYENLAQSQGTINIDLGGHMLSSGRVNYSLFPAYTKAYTGAAGKFVFPTNVIISNGTLRHSQSGIVGMRTWDNTHDGQIANKEFNFTFNDVTFGFVDGANSVGLVAHALSSNNSGGAPTVAAPFNFTYNDCIFDVKTTTSSFNSATLFSTTNSQYVKVKHTVNGGVVKTGGSSVTFYTTDKSYGSSVTFEKGSDGKYLSYIVPSTLSVTSDAFPSSAGSLYWAKTGVSGSDAEYVLEKSDGAGVTTQYGIIPNDKVSSGTVFAVFAKKASDTTYTFINTFGSMREGALNNSRDLVKRNSGAYAGGTVVIYMLKDYNYSTGGNGTDNFNRGFQIDGTMIIDLGGYKLTIDNKPRLIGFETGSDDIIGTASGYNTVLKFVNGAIKADNPVVEVFGGSSSYTGTKALEVSFEDIEFEPKSGTDARKIVISRHSFKSGQSVNMKLGYTDCTFNYASSGVVLYDDIATGDNSNPVVADVKVNGGNIKVADLSKLTLRTDTAHDSVTFGKNASGERTTFTLKYTDSAPTATFATDAGTMSLATESLTNQMISGKTTITYSLSNAKRGNYGYVPLSKAGSTFAMFYNNHHVGSYDNLNHQSTGALNAVKNLLYGGNKSATLGALQGETLTIYTNKDYENEVTTNRFDNYAQIDGNIVLDLGGHTITQTQNTYLFSLIAKAVDGELPTASTTVKNGKILTTSHEVMIIQSSGTDGNFGYEGTKTFDFTFDNVTFDKHTSYATYYAPLVKVDTFNDNGGKKNVAYNATFDNCTFNSSDSVLFNLASSNYVDANVTINGGNLTAKSMGAAGVMKTSNSEDKFTFGNPDGAYTTLYMPKTASAPKATFNNGSLEFVLASETADKLIFKLAPVGVGEGLKTYSPKMSLTLDSTLKMNIYVPEQLTQTYTIDGEEKVYDSKVTLTDGKVYFRKTVDLTSSDAIRDIVLKVTVSTGGKDVNGTFTFSVLKYANKIFENGKDVEKQLIRDVLSYIRAAYKQFAASNTDAIAKIDALIGAKYEEMTPFTPTKVNVNPTKFKSATFQLGGTPAFRFYLNSGDDASKYTFKIVGEEVEAITGSDSNGTYLQVAVYAYQMCEKITYYANGAEVGNYHISSYYEWAKTQNNATLVNTVERFWAYCQSAKDYKNSVEVEIKYVDEAGKELATTYKNAYKKGEEFSVLSPAVEGYYTRDVYKIASATSDTVYKVVYKKIPSGVKASEVEKILPNIASWGDSITAGQSAYNTTIANQYSIDLAALGSTAKGATYSEVLQNLIAGRVYSGIDVANCGVNGESTATITARANAENYYLYLGTGVTIGSEPVVIDLKQKYPTTINPGRLGVLRTSLKDSLSHVTIEDGKGTKISGIITCEKVSNIPESETYKDIWNCDLKYLVYSFTRTDGGTNKVTLGANSKVIMNASVDYDGRTCIVFMGENNGYSNVGTNDRDVKILIAQQKELLKACGNPEKFLIISSTSGSTASRKGITEALTAEWGDRYINIGNELNSSRKAYDLVGYSEADIVSVQQNIIEGTVTSLLLNDTCHPHAVGYAAVGNIMFERMFNLGMFDELFDYYDSLQQ